MNHTDAGNEWEKYYSREDVQKWLRGEMTLQELNGLSPEVMNYIAQTGYYLYTAGRYPDARIVFEGLAAMSPKEAYYFSALGAVYLAENDLPMAAKVLSRAIELDPRDQSALVNRGEVYLRTGELVSAAQDLRKAVELDPEGREPFTARALAMGRAASEAIKFLQQNGEEMAKKLSLGPIDNSSRKPEKSKAVKKK